MSDEWSLNSEYTFISDDYVDNVFFFFLKINKIKNKTKKKPIFFLFLITLLTH